MENASKALIIAGAILISILIIGLGVFIYNQAKGAIGNTGIDAQAAESNNQQFTAYFGNNKSAAEVKNLISLVRSYNINKSTSAGGYTIGFMTDGPDLCSNITEASDYVTMGRTYVVKSPNEDNTSQADDSEKPNEGKGGTAGYYSNGFIRVIQITAVT